jgi:3-oxoacyl-[acyl-carrier-protein] synthase-1
VVVSRPVHVVAVGARTPVGLRAATSAAAVRAGIVRIGEHDTLMDPAGDPLRAAVDGKLGPERLGAERLIELFPMPLQEVLEALPPRDPRDPVPVLLALPEPRPGFGVAHEQRLHARLAQVDVPGRPLRAQTAGRGHAGGLQALHQARELVATGRLELVVVGGVDGYLDADTLEWLGRARRIATRHTRSSFFPGEGAGFVALASDTLVRAQRLPSLATLVGSGLANEPTAASSDPYAVNLGRGLVAAIRAATAGLPAGPRIDRVLCDINGERARSEEWGMAMLTMHAVLAPGTDYEAPSTSWGDVGAASGPLLVGLAVQGWARGHHGGGQALVFCGSDSGLRGAVVLERPAAAAR